MAGAASAEPLSRPQQAGPRSAAGLVRAIGRHRTATLCLGIVIADQATKAAQPAGTFVVNTGGGAILPPALGDALWSSPTLGAACDTLDTVLLLVALRMAGRLATSRQRAAAAAGLAGLLSNLADRLGASALFHAGLPRGAIDWISVPSRPPVKINLADVVIVTGALVLGCHLARSGLRALRSRARRARGGQLAAVIAGIVAVFLWTTFWQANRDAAVRPGAPFPASTVCCLISYPSGGRVPARYPPRCSSGSSPAGLPPCYTPW